MLDFTCIVKKKTYYISPVKVYALCSTYIFALRFILTHLAYRANAKKV